MILERVPHSIEHVQGERIEVGRARRNRAGERGDHRCLEKGSQREHRRVARRHRGRLRHLASPRLATTSSAARANLAGLCGKRASDEALRQMEVSPGAGLRPVHAWVPKTQ